MQTARWKAGEAESPDPAVIGGQDVENLVVQLLVVLGFCILVPVLLVWCFSWEGRRRPK